MNRGEAACRRQSGAALLMLLAVAMVGVLSLLLGRLNQDDPHAAAERITMAAMAQAKQALIGWAASNATLPGQFPCPEDLSLIGGPAEGSALAGNCGLSPGATVQGRLPWRTLGLPLLRDGSDEPLWYAFSSNYRLTPINSATPAGLTVDGVANSAVAIVFAPGPELAGQVRSKVTVAPGTYPVRGNYLESPNSTGFQFSRTALPGVLNDRLLLVTKADLMRVVERRVATELATRLGAYYRANLYFPYAAAANDGACAAGMASGFVPLAAGSCSHPAFPAALTVPLDSLPPWYAANEWEKFMTYQVGAGCLQSSPAAPAPGSVPDCGGAGRLTLGPNTAVKALLASAYAPATVIVP